MKKTFTIITTILILTILSSGVNATHRPAHTCSISTGHGLLSDDDCDDVPDQKDNCPQTPNKRQSDSDLDGIGNACDPTYKAPGTQTQQQEQQTKQTLQATINAIEIQDILAGGPGAVYPIKITNNADTTQRFTLDLEGVRFGTYRFDPGNEIIVNPGETKTAYIHAVSNEDIEEGQYTFTLTISNQDTSRNIAMTANVLHKETKTSILQTIGEIIAWILLITVAIIIIGLIIREIRKSLPTKKNKQTEDEEIQSYY